MLLSRLAPPVSVLMLVGTLPPIVLTREQLERGPSVPDSWEEDDEQSDPVFWSSSLQSPGPAVLAAVNELCTFPLASAIPGEDNPLKLTVPFMML